MNDQNVSAEKPMALVVDDSRVVRSILTKILTEMGFTVREASNGKEALICFEREGGKIRLLLVDWNMPEMNGLELVETLRRDPAKSSVIVVMVTTESDPEEMARALRAGTNAYVTKPFTPEILRQKLHLAGISRLGARGDDEQPRVGDPAGAGKRLLADLDGRATNDSGGNV
jgi:two-component system, chemotaxis family, chemotaxis protein CheY